MKRLLTILTFTFLSIVLYAQKTDGTPNAHLQGRTVLGTLPRPSYAVQNEGIVAVTIWVDQYGTVQKAIAGADGTTVTDNELWEAARKAALGAHFNMNADAPALQQGTITYHFKLRSKSDKQTETETAIPVKLPSASTPQPSILKFLGIPVDGKKSDMIEALKEKGFVYLQQQDVLLGTFNGVPSIVSISDNHGIVDRVVVDDQNGSDVSQIRIRYNTLLSQFRNTQKYYEIAKNDEIPEDEDISYEITVHNKRYEADFYLNPLLDNEALQEHLVQEILNEIDHSIKVGELVNPTEEQLTEMKYVLLGQKTVKLTTGTVWYMINTHMGKYSIATFYDNLNNRPHGEDL